MSSSAALSTLSLALRLYSALSHAVGWLVVKNRRADKAEATRAAPLSTNRQRAIQYAADEPLRLGKDGRCWGVAR